VTPVLMTDCTGLWRRTLLVEADGTRDTGTDVQWLQGTTAYVDSRGFAGRLDQRGDVFEWSRFVDVEPPGPCPDAGRMHWNEGTLIEVGVHADYTEHWLRDEGPVAPCGALFLDSAILVRVGDRFGWADRGGVVLGTIGGPEWSALSPRMNGKDLEVHGTRWNVVDSEGDMDL
jgi:hypothetical protein